MASRGGLHEIIPGKLYQRGQFLTWPAKQKLKMLNEYGITLVVNLWSKIDGDLSPDDLNRIYINWHTSPSEVPPNAKEMMIFIADMINLGHVVLIHCEAGRGRSVWLSAKVYDALTITKTPTEILAHMKAAVPGLDVTAALRRDLGWPV